MRAGEAAGKSLHLRMEVTSLRGAVDKHDRGPVRAGARPHDRRILPGHRRLLGARGFGRSRGNPSGDRGIDRRRENDECGGLRVDP